MRKTIKEMIEKLPDGTLILIEYGKGEYIIPYLKMGNNLYNKHDNWTYGIDSYYNIDTIDEELKDHMYFKKVKVKSIQVPNYKEVYSCEKKKSRSVISR